MENSGLFQDRIKISGLYQACAKHAFMILQMSNKCMNDDKCENSTYQYR